MKMANTHPGVEQDQIAGAPQAGSGIAGIESQRCIAEHNNLLSVWVRFLRLRLGARSGPVSLGSARTGGVRAPPASSFRIEPRLRDRFHCIKYFRLLAHSV